MAAVTDLQLFKFHLICQQVPRYGQTTPRQLTVITKVLSKLFTLYPVHHSLDLSTIKTSATAAAHIVDLQFLVAKILSYWDADRICRFLGLHEWTSTGNIEEAKTRILAHVRDGQESLDLSNLGLSSLPLKALSYLSLTSLNCSGNRLQHADFSSLPSLVNLDCSSNQLVTLNLSNLVNLQVLCCKNNEFPTFNIPDSPRLHTLNCSSNCLVRAPVVCHCACLQQLDYSVNKLVLLELSNFVALENLACHCNNLTILILPATRSLASLNCSFNSLTGVTLTDVPCLQRLCCFSNSFNELDVTCLQELSYLFCSNNKLRVLRFSSSVSHLDCSNNSLTKLDFPVPTSNLTVLDCSENSLEALALTDFAQLQIIDCSHNKIQRILLGKLPLLTSFCASHNALRAFFYQCLPQLRILDVQSNSLDSAVLIPENLPSLEEYNCSSNPFSFLTMAQLPNLHTLKCSQSLLNTLRLQKLPALKYADCSYCQLEELSLYELPSLEHLDYSNNPRLTSVEVREFTTLQHLNCSYTALSTLNVFGLRALISLNCSHNPSMTTLHDSLLHLPDACTLNLDGCRITSDEYTRAERYAAAFTSLYMICHVFQELSQNSQATAAQLTIIRRELPSLCYFTGCPLNTIPSLSHFLNQSLATTETLFTYYLHVHRALFSLINGENLYIFLGLHTWNINGNRTEAIERITACFLLAKPTLNLANLGLSSLPEQALSLCYFLRDLDCSYNCLNAPATSLPASLKGVNYSHNPFHQTGVFIPNDVPDSSV